MRLSNKYSFEVIRSEDEFALWWAYFCRLRKIEPPALPVDCGRVDLGNGTFLVKGFVWCPYHWQDVRCGGCPKQDCDKDFDSLVVYYLFDNWVLDFNFFVVCPCAPVSDTDFFALGRALGLI